MAAKKFPHCTDCPDTEDCRVHYACFNQQMRRNPKLPPLHERPFVETTHNDNAIPDRELPGYMGGIAIARFYPSDAPRFPCPGRLRSPTEIADIADRIVTRFHEQSKTEQGTPLFHLRGDCAVQLKHIIREALQESVS